MKLIIAIIAWLSILVLLLWYSGSGQLSHFSPNNKPVDTAELFSKIQSEHRIDGPALLHFYDSKCRCNLVAEPHINSVKELAKTSEFLNILIDINKNHGWKERIPSTPAVIAVSNGQITYFGPYSTGPSCLPGEGLIEPFILTPTKTPKVLTDGFGCYCNTGA